MKKRILYSALALLLSVSSFAQTRKVLWIGNSYTYVNDLPNVFRQLALSGGDTLIVDSSAPGGYTFLAHTTNATTLQKLALTNNDFVVLQAQSQEPSFPPSQVASETFPYAQLLDSLAHQGTPCAKTVFYMTWGRKYGDTQNCPNYPPLCTFQGMNDRLRSSYKLMADANQAMLAPAGMAWRKSWETDSTINLWSADNSHPSLAGTYLTACVFYGTILRKNPVGLSYTAGLNAVQAAYLQQIAQSTVFDSLSTWNIGRYDVNASFNYVLNGTTVNFENLSTYATDFQWNYGDGNVSSEVAANHNYEGASGTTFNVQLIATNGCESDTSTVEIALEPSGISTKTDELGWRVYPNPASKQVMIQASHPTQFSIAIYNAEGTLMRQYEEKGTIIPLSIEHYPAGIYQVVCTSGKEQRIFRMVKQ